jgi:hypothetical protein
LRTIPPNASLLRKRAEEPGWRKRLMVANWTEKRLKRLKLLNKEGFSATVIAGKLGPAFTKSIGRHQFMVRAPSARCVRAWDVTVPAA